jgi:hypothetical protein
MPETKSLETVDMAQKGTKKGTGQKKTMGGKICWLFFLMKHCFRDSRQLKNRSADYLLDKLATNF